jgi:hypothetical protein
MGSAGRLQAGQGDGDEAAGGCLGLQAARGPERGKAIAGQFAGRDVGLDFPVRANATAQAGVSPKLVR